MSHNKVYTFLKQVWVFTKDIWHLNWEIKIVKKRPKIIFCEKGKIKEEKDLKHLEITITQTIEQSYKLQPKNRTTIPPECVPVIVKDGMIYGPWHNILVNGTMETGVLIKGNKGGEDQK